MGKRTKAVGKKNVWGELEISLRVGGCQLAVPATSPCRARSAASAPRAAPGPDGQSSHTAPSPPAAPPSAHRAALHRTGCPFVAPEPGH